MNLIGGESVSLGVGGIEFVRNREGDSGARLGGRELVSLYGNEYGKGSS